MRRLIPAAAALALLAAPAFAQTTTQTPAAPTTTPAPSTTAPAPTTETTPKPATTHHAHRMSLQKRFEAANTTHDGHLTKDQAAAANWSYVVNHFSAMDKDGKGYVTVQDIHAYAVARHAAMHHHTTAPSSTQPAAPNNNG